MSVLLVEDEPVIRSLVRSQLQDQGLHVTVAATVAEADAALALRTFVVVILDLTLPDGSGLDVLDRLHTSGSSSHVIVLSGSAAEADRVRALERGADDFVVKPFSMRELTARVLAVGRRRAPMADAMFKIGDFDIDLRAREVSSAGEKVELTAKEFDLLAYLAVRPGHVFDREQLLNAVWRSASEWQQAATVTEHIRRLRGKLEVDPAQPTLLITVRGAGYRLDLPAVDLLRQTERLLDATAGDELTGLANRRVLDRVLPRATSGSVVMIDLDHFEDVNDRHGHAAGDAVLVSFAEVLIGQVGAQDTTCRFGREGFALVLTDADASGAVDLLGRIRTAWSAAAPRAVTFSAGVAAVDTDGGMAALLAADRALHEAKTLGRDRTEVAAAPVDREERRGHQRSHN